MRLIDNWASSWKFLSSQFGAAISALSTTWLAIPEEYKTPTANKVMSFILSVLGGLVVFGRLIQQTPTIPKPGDAK
jgi:hypothetical protein